MLTYVLVGVLGCELPKQEQQQCPQAWNEAYVLQQCGPMLQQLNLSNPVVYHCLMSMPLSPRIREQLHSVAMTPPKPQTTPEKSLEQ